MKKQLLFVTLYFLLVVTSLGQSIDPAPADKAVVYFTRTSAAGFAINFSYFDSTKLIGRFNGPKYIRYECDPGTHLFWARSENRDFVEADVEAGKIYFIEAIVKMGAMKAAVELQPVKPDDKKKMDRIFKLLSKKPSESFTAQQLEEDTKSLDDAIARGMEKYNEDKKKGKTIAKLEKSMYYKE